MSPAGVLVEHEAPVVALDQLGRGEQGRDEENGGNEDPHAALKPLASGRVTVTVRDADDAEMPHTLRHAVLERTPDGKRVLHLQANAPRKGIERVATRAVFVVRGQ